MGASGPFRRRGLLIALLAAALLGGCRDAVNPYVPGGAPGSQSGDTVRLTYSAGQDRSPAWVGNDSLVYSGAGFDPYPIWPGVLLEMPRQGPTALLFLPTIHQSPLAKQYATPVPSPSGDRVAFVDLEALGDSLCRYTTVYWSLGVDPVPAPPPMHLLTGRLVVRERAATGALSDDPRVVFAFEGITQPGTTYITRYLPFQRAFSEGKGIAFRPSWSPDGQKLVFSDGSRLLLWTVGQAEAVPLAGGAGGVSPAWSPRGDQIAFSKPVVVDSSRVTYTYIYNSRLSCAEQRTRYTQAASRLMVVPAAGGTARDLGDGDEPAWSPDGSTIYARSWADEVYHIPAAGGTPVVMPALRYSNDLAISPDGNWLAYTRTATNGKHDVWVVPLSR